MIALRVMIRAAVAGSVVLGGLATASAALAEGDQGSIARGGRLYDKWYKEIRADAPAESHPLYPAEAHYADDPGANWRCKECHGWDRQGVDGAYATGKHSTGIIGVDGMAGGDPAAVIAVLSSPEHGYGDKLSEQDMTDLANFVVYGKVDWASYINPETAAPLGDVVAGGQVYNTICAKCHGPEGTLPKEMPPLGSLMGNPWEVMHKIMNGQPNEAMPGLRAIDLQVTADVLSYLTTLPQE